MGPPPPSLLRDCAAVTAQIGVALMVAVTAALGAGLVMLADRFMPVDSAAPVTFVATPEDRTDSISVAGVQGDVRFSDLRVGASKHIALRTGAQATLAATNPGSQDLPVGAWIQPDPARGSQPVPAGTRFSLCGGGVDSGQELAQVTVQIVHLPTNTLVFEGTFASVQACA